eukprot:827278-Rhodomonas_salina.3
MALRYPPIDLLCAALYSAMYGSTLSAYDTCLCPSPYSHSLCCYATSCTEYYTLSCTGVTCGAKPFLVLTVGMVIRAVLYWRRICCYAVSRADEACCGTRRS